jgi:hypothetical protein
MLPKIYLHWTATGYNWVQDGHYHTIVTGDGKVHRRHDYTIDLYTHTYLRNNNSIGVSCSCMGGNPDPWSMPPTDAQVEAMCREVSRVVKDWGWKEQDISVVNIMTHAEAASNRDGWFPHENYGPLAWGGTGERWDFMQLTKQGKDNGGDLLREKIRGYYRGTNTLIPTPLKFVSEQKIEANGKPLTVAVDEKGSSWAAAADLLAQYNLAFQWNSEQRRILIGSPDVVPKYLQDRVQADVGYPLCEMSLQGSNSRVILTGIIRNGRAFIRVLEFAEEFGITRTFNPLKLGRRLGG